MTLTVHELMDLLAAHPRFKAEAKKVRGGRPPIYIEILTQRKDLHVASGADDEPPACSMIVLDYVAGTRKLAGIEIV